MSDYRDQLLDMLDKALGNLAAAHHDTATGLRTRIKSIQIAVQDCRRNPALVEVHAEAAREWEHIERSAALPKSEGPISTDTKDTTK